MRSLMRKLLAAPLLITALLCVPVAAYAAQDAVTWQCTPAEGETVYPGDTISYKITTGQAGATEDWTALRVQLGKGMRFLPESVQVLPAQTEENAPAVEEDAGDASAEETPDAEQAETIRDVVPGNDGFVVLLSRLNEGDTFVFSAAVEAEDAVVNALVQTDAFISDVSHVLGVLPSQEAAVPDVPADSAQAADPPKALQWVLVQLCAAGLGFIVYIAYRKWGQALLPLLCKLIAGVRQIIKARQTGKTQVPDKDQASLAQKNEEDQDAAEPKLAEQCKGAARE